MLNASITQEKVQFLDLLVSHKQFRLVVVTHVEEVKTQSGTVLEIHCIRPISHEYLYNLHVMYTLSFCLTSLMFKCVL